MQVRPFLLTGQSTLDAVLATIERAATAWAAQWGVAPAGVSVRAERACDAVAAKGLLQGMGNGARTVWCGVPPELSAEVQRLLFAADSNYGPQAEVQPHFAPAAARKALDALLAAVRGAAVPAALEQAGEPDGAIWRRGSGAVLVTVKLGKQQCRVLLNAAAVSALQQKPVPLPGLAPLKLQNVLADVPVRLELSIGAAKVGLSNLMTLGVGDVIRLDAAIDAPLPVRAPSGTVLFDAYLGRMGDSVAVEVVARN